MKWIRLSTTSRQLIILGLLIALLSVGSKPAPGPDGRIVCNSANYPNHLTVSRYEPYENGTTVKIIAFTIEGRKLVNHFTLRQIPIVSAVKYEPNKTLRRLCDICPSLLKLPQIEVRVRGGWTYSFSVTPHEWEVLQGARLGNVRLLIAPDSKHFPHSE